MKQASKTLLSLVLLLALTFVACKNDNDPVNCANNFNIGTEVANEINNITAASQAYANDPSNANCNALKDAYQDYIDALRDLENCARNAGVLAEWTQSLNEAEDNIDTIC